MNLEQICVQCLNLSCNSYAFTPISAKASTQSYSGLCCFQNRNKSVNLCKDNGEGRELRKVFCKAEKPVIGTEVLRSHLSPARVFVPELTARRTSDGKLHAHLASNRSIRDTTNTKVKIKRNDKNGVAAGQPKHRSLFEIGLMSFMATDFMS
jgi:hypothetical protein